MQRWWVIPRNYQFNIYYHRILRNDDDRALHDHPWPSFSIMTKGALREITNDGAHTIMAGDCVFREPEMAHRLELIGNEPAETLFITGAACRDWGFHCPKGWRHWRDFVAQNEGEIGRGCGEMDETESYLYNKEPDK
jgi:hypothetical protein